MPKRKETCYMGFSLEADVPKTVELDNWLLESSGDYLFVKHSKHPGCIDIKSDKEGFVVDIWDDEAMHIMATMSAMYQDLRQEEADL